MSPAYAGQSPVFVLGWPVDWPDGPAVMYISPPVSASAASAERVMSRDIVSTPSHFSLLTSYLSLPRPHHTLFALGHRADALVHEALHALALVGLGCVDVAFGVGRDAVHRVELAGLAAAVAERRELGERHA